MAGRQLRRPAPTYSMSSAGRGAGLTSHDAGVARISGTTGRQTQTSHVRHPLLSLPDGRLGSSGSSFLTFVPVISANSNPVSIRRQFPSGNRGPAKPIFSGPQPKLTIRCSSTLVRRPRQLSD